MASRVCSGHRAQVEFLYLCEISCMAAHLNWSPPLLVPAGPDKRWLVFEHDVLSPPSSGWTEREDSLLSLRRECATRRWCSPPGHGKWVAGPILEKTNSKYSDETTSSGPTRTWWGWRKWPNVSCWRNKTEVDEDEWTHVMLVMRSRPVNSSCRTK